MKKTLLLVGLLGFILSGCSYYTCPTYAKAEIENNNGSELDRHENI